jgi:hypothetical protein
MQLINILANTGPWPDSWDFTWSKIWPFMMLLLEPLVPIISYAFGIVLVILGLGMLVNQLRR